MQVSSELTSHWLQALCEKGLVAMENSHRRIVAEMRGEHERQLEQLRVEKEEALAEETQATLAGQLAVTSFITCSNNSVTQHQTTV